MMLNPFPKQTAMTHSSTIQVRMCKEASLLMPYGKKLTLTPTTFSLCKEARPANALCMLLNLSHQLRMGQRSGHSRTLAGFAARCIPPDYMRSQGC